MTDYPREAVFVVAITTGVLCFIAGLIAGSLFAKYLLS
jgi:hypothetical protein